MCIHTYICIHKYIYIYIYTYIYVLCIHFWEKESTPWHFWERKSRLTGVPKSSLCQKTLKRFAVTPLVPTPFVPLRVLHAGGHVLALHELLLDARGRPAPVYISVCLSIYLSIYRSIYLSIYICIYIYIHIYIYICI